MNSPNDDRAVIPLSSGLTSRVSLEVIDHIIQNYTDENFMNYTSLSSCSLVCSEWLDIARRYLFSSVTVRQSFAQAVNASPHAAQTVIPHIRSVALGGRWISDEQDFRVVITFLRSLMRLKVLHLEAWSPDDRTLHALTTLPFPHLTTLSLKYVGLPSRGSFFLLAGCFPILEVLTVDNVTFDKTEASISARDSVYPQASTPPLLLRHLSLVCCNTEVFLEWVLGSGVRGIDHSASGSVHDRPSRGPPPLSTLILPDYLPHETTLVDAILRVLGSSLTRLELGMLPSASPSFRSRYSSDLAFTTFPLGSESDSEESCQPQLSLSTNANLRNLHVHQLTLYQLVPSPTLGKSSMKRVPAPSPYSSLIPLLASISSPLAEVTLHIWLSEEWHLDWINWVALGEVFLAPPFSFHTFSHLSIRVRGISARTGNVKAWILRRLHGTNDQLAAKLVVEYDD